MVTTVVGYLCRGRKVNLKPKLGLAIGSLLHAASPRKVKFLQSAVSIQLWKGGLKSSVMNQMSRLGICQGYNGALSSIDKIRIGFDAAAKNAMKELQETIPKDVILENDKMVSIVMTRLELTKSVVL